VQIHTQQHMGQKEPNENSLSCMPKNTFVTLSSSISSIIEYVHVPRRQGLRAEREPVGKVEYSALGRTFALYVVQILLLIMVVVSLAIEELYCCHSPPNYSSDTHHPRQQSAVGISGTSSYSLSPNDTTEQIQYSQHSNR